MVDDGWKKPVFILKWMNKYFDSLMEKLDAIQNMFGTSGDADVSSADIRLGKKAYNGTTLVTGTMPENVAVAETLAAGEAYVIPQGYHDGTGKVTADSLASQTDGTATAAQILSGKTAYVDGKKVTGSMGNKAGTTVEASAVTQDDTNTYFNVPAAGYYDTNSKVYTPNSNLGKLKECMELTNNTKMIIAYAYFNFIPYNCNQESVAYVEPVIISDLKSDATIAKHYYHQHSIDSIITFTYNSTNQELTTNYTGTGTPIIVKKYYE